MEEGVVHATGIQNGEFIKVVFRSYGAVVAGIVAIVAMTIIGGATVSSTFIISLSFLILLVAFIHFCLDRQKRAAELEKQRKDDAWNQRDSDRDELENLLSDSEDSS